MQTDKKPPPTLRQLHAALSKLTPEQLDMPTQWWGEETGGHDVRLTVLAEDYTDMSEGEGLSPMSEYTGTADEEAAKARIRVKAGTPILAID